MRSHRRYTGPQRVKPHKLGEDPKAAPELTYNDFIGWQEQCHETALLLRKDLSWMPEDAPKREVVTQLLDVKELAREASQLASEAPRGVHKERF